MVRYGYLRGEETYGYVTSIRERWQTLPRCRPWRHDRCRSRPVAQEFSRRIQKQSTECRRTGSQVQTEYAITHDGRDSGLFDEIRNIMQPDMDHTARYHALDTLLLQCA